MVLSFGLSAQDSTFIKIHFKYGSKPAKGYKKSETKYFGGIHGGHVTVEVGDSIYGFSPIDGGAKPRVFAKKSHSNGWFHLEEEYVFTYDSLNTQLLTIKIPVSKTELSDLRNQAKLYLNNAPYDYGLFGMRCAASAQEFLSVTSLYKKRSKLSIILRTFYPKKLRKRLLDSAFENNYEITYQEGRKERKWEKDKRRHRKRLVPSIKP